MQIKININIRNKNNLIFQVIIVCHMIIEPRESCDCRDNEENGGGGGGGGRGGGGGGGGGGGDDGSI